MSTLAGVLDKAGLNGGQCQPGWRPDLSKPEGRAEMKRLIERFARMRPVVQTKLVIKFNGKAFADCRVEPAKTLPQSFAKQQLAEACGVSAVVAANTIQQWKEAGWLVKVAVDGRKGWLRTEQFGRKV